MPGSICEFIDQANCYATLSPRLSLLSGTLLLDYQNIVNWQWFNGLTNFVILYCFFSIHLLKAPWWHNILLVSLKSLLLGNKMSYIDVFRYRNWPGLFLRHCIASVAEMCWPSLLLPRNHPIIYHHLTGSLTNLFRSFDPSRSICDSSTNVSTSFWDSNEFFCDFWTYLIYILSTSNSISVFF